ncbi:MAG TPA: hypothetical protein ENK55_10995 [Actinobacteria bacterium]|nr:hypothetical protein [Actinomycetota bacterium]
MAMSKAHKEALAEGRRAARAIKAYLQALATPKRRGRPVDPARLQEKIAQLDERIRGEADPLRRVELIQARLDAMAALDAAQASDDLAELEKGFVEYAAGYSERKGITYAAWREAGVPASVLKAAGIKRTRRA